MNKKMENNKVLLGMSGGVDSSVSAILLKEKGYNVHGVTMKLWEDKKVETENGCCSFSTIVDAKKVCDKLKIPHSVLEFKNEFNKYVIQNFIYEYSNCRTPNPCVRCNKFLKFGLMYEEAEKLKLDYIATGHYAKIEYSDKYGRYVLKKAANINKDQSYFLYNIPKKLLSKIIFPLGEFVSKQDVRKVAERHELEVSKKPDSEDICFIPNGDYKKFLESNSLLKQKSGNIVNIEGIVIGQHTGLYKYTIGQRKGLGVSNNKPLYVIGFNIDKNELIVGEKDSLYKKEMLVNNINLLLIDEFVKPIQVKVKTRYSSNESEATIELIDKDLIKVFFNKPVSSITPGQSAVFYLDDIVLGGGIIVE